MLRSSQCSNNRCWCTAYFWLGTSWTCEPLYVRALSGNELVMIVFQVLVKALVSMDTGDDTEFRKKQFNNSWLVSYLYQLTYLEVDSTGHYRQRRKWLN
ncbi:hypothetical protein LOK49_LG05G02579 [Camellia lanceoleosa]|uniref:Uncharacterized protein n=1 Tax=Camellia lanceoleosa TaxID=1840588 RepID=A0ACC0HVF0_9ERIC|nr:hypothetical protein LOK49_LG05G02579 [Camellia lanceoleosa]